MSTGTDALPQALRDLGGQLAELAGAAAFAAGLAYLRKGAVADRTISPSAASAIVTGSTQYRVSVKLADAVVRCTCPAHRRNKHCKHVVALVAALLQQPETFQEVADSEPPVPEKSPRPKREGRSGARKAEERAALRASGLGLVDRLLEEVTTVGLDNVGAEQRALLGNAAETVKALKLRRLGNLLQELRMSLDDAGRDPADRSAGRLLTEIALTRRAVGAALDGSVTLDPVAAEELIGKTWRDADLERVSDLELLAVGSSAESSAEFRVESTFLLDLASGRLLVERQITPRGIRAKPMPPRRLLLLVDHAGLYPAPPDLPGRRVKLLATRQAPLTRDHVDRALGLAQSKLAPVRAAARAGLDDPFAAHELPVLFRPSDLLVRNGEIAARDADGAVLPLTVTGPRGRRWTHDLPDPDSFALLLLVGITGGELTARCVGAFGHLAGDAGPVASV